MSRTIRVLHVDDDDSLLGLTKTMLEREGEDITVESASSGRDGLRCLRENGRVDCIVCDYEMPGMDGLDLLESVRQRRPDLPFILFTGRGSEEIASRALSAGATEYLQKGGGSDQYTVLANRIGNAVAKRRAEREREQARNRYQALIEHSSDLITILDDDGVFQYTSPATEQVLGYEPETLIGEPSFEMVHPDDLAAVMDAFSRMREDPSATPSISYRLRHANGEWRHIESRGANRLDDPAIEGYVINTRDVTDRVEAEQQLSEEQELFDAALDALPHVFYVAKLDGSGWRWNSRLEEVSGYSNAELRDIDIEDIFAAEDIPKIESVIDRVRDGETATYEARIKKKSGEFERRRISASLLTDDDGGPIGICGIGVSLDEDDE
ncbi:PAS domain-containing response regulator [Haloarchaeobius iranensis]|uniref:histidine kinase n=1 Tax=Haloarchaeobius iranensis TaxID=996166 RepID=A0A1G9VWE6_9EURY|nr:PAS domain S-box protein [Haloarchaeobius iranensis]SDM76443.1 PAS domain S-box-containing protein [Haloarchaeobius iranensis]